MGIADVISVHVGNLNTVSKAYSSLNAQWKEHYAAETVETCLKFIKTRYNWNAGVVLYLRKGYFLESIQNCVQNLFLFAIVRTSVDQNTAPGVVHSCFIYINDIGIAIV